MKVRGHCNAVRLSPQAGAKEMTTDENIDPKHPPTSAPVSSSAQNINNNKMERIRCFWNKNI